MGERFGLLGHPVEHSLSPVLFRAAFDALGLDHRYSLLDAPTEDDAARVVADVRAATLAGVTVTMPHKLFALRSADRCSPAAEACGAANVLAREGAALVAHQTDAPALAAMLAGSTGAALVLGAGGAARAAVWAARSVGLAPVWATTRSWSDAGAIRADPRADAVARAGGVPLAWGPAGEVSRGPAGEVTGGPPSAPLGVVVQATSAGALGHAGDAVLDAVPWETLGGRALAVDVVYRPRFTPFLRRAREAGLATKGGLEMLVLQASRALRIWLGDIGPLGAIEAEMTRAATAALTSEPGA